MQLPTPGPFCYDGRMNQPLFAAIPLLVLSLFFGAGCVSSRHGDKPVPEVDPADALTPIRSKYAVVAPADIPDAGTLRIAVVDADFSGNPASLALLLAEYTPANGYCHFLGDREECASVDALVQAIDRHVDQMPFGILFTHRGQIASAANVAPTLPAAYQAFFREFRAAMAHEDIDFLTLVPDKIVFLR